MNPMYNWKLRNKVMLAWWNGLLSDQEAKAWYDKLLKEMQ